MAGLTGGRKKRLVLDIGASAIRLAELAQTKAGFQLVKYHQREFNSDPAQDEEERKALKQKAQPLGGQGPHAEDDLGAGPVGVHAADRCRRCRNHRSSAMKSSSIPDQIAMDYQIRGTEAGGYVMMAAIKVTCSIADRHPPGVSQDQHIARQPLAAYNWLKYWGNSKFVGVRRPHRHWRATTDIVIEWRGSSASRPLNSAVTTLHSPSRRLSA